MTNTLSDSPKRSVGSRHMMSVMIACALTWSFGSVTNFFVAQDAHTTRRADTAALDMPSLQQREEQQQYRQVHFLPGDQLSINDMFSATWLQPVENFLKMNVANIKTVEDGCFQAFRPDLGAVRMTLDWLDFSVEHMSKVRNECVSIVLWA